MRSSKDNNVIPLRLVGGLETLDDDPPVESCIGPSGHTYTSTSCFCLLPGMEPRRTAIRIAELPLFDPFILVVIQANCTTMAWESCVTCAESRDSARPSPDVLCPQPTRPSTATRTRSRTAPRAPRSRSASRAPVLSVTLSHIVLSHRPLDPHGTPKAHFIAACEWVFLVIFTAEMLIKVVAYGLLFHRGADSRISHVPRSPCGDQRAH
jgi:hypothetical protein